MAEISNPVALGDIVRIKQNPETIQAGIAGLEGTVYGFTTHQSHELLRSAH